MSLSKLFIFCLASHLCKILEWSPFAWGYQHSRYWKDVSSTININQLSDLCLGFLQVFSTWIMSFQNMITQSKRSLNPGSRLANPIPRFYCGGRRRNDQGQIKCLLLTQLYRKVGGKFLLGFIALSLLLLLHAPSSNKGNELPLTYIYCEVNTIYFCFYSFFVFDL